MLAPLFDERPFHILTVTEVTRDIKDLLEDTFASVWVEGEISNWRVVQSGHAYFTLKDAQSQLRTVMFRSALRQLPFAPEAGMQVVAHGRLTVYEPRGDYQPGRNTGIALETTDARADHDELKSAGVDVDDILGGEGPVPVMFFMRDNEKNEVIAERLLQPAFCLRAGTRYDAVASILSMLASEGRVRIRLVEARRES